MKKILLVKKHPTPQEVLKALPKSKVKIAFADRLIPSINQEQAESYIVDCNMASDKYAIAVIFKDDKNVERWLVATMDEINKQQTEVA